MKLLNKTNLIVLSCLLLAIVGLKGATFVNAHPAAGEITLPIATNAPETRCGWFVNPTPGNAWLNDKDGQWIIGEQGGHQADGDWPDFGSKWVKTNGNYGYGCACMRVNVNRQNKEVLSIISSTAKPIAACRKDRALKKP